MEIPVEIVLKGKLSEIVAYIKNPQSKKEITNFDYVTNLDAELNLGQQYSANGLVPAVSKNMFGFFPFFKDSSKGEVIFLTGATGFLGVFLLQQILTQENSLKKVICLVRAKTLEEGRKRIENSMKENGIWDQNFSEKIDVVCNSDPGVSGLGNRRIIGTKLWSERHRISVPLY